MIFASLVDDPEDCPEFETEGEWQAERERLHRLIERLVVWENVQPDSEGDVIGEARREIARPLARARSTSSGRTEAAPTDPKEVLAYLREHAPPLHDPFAGGGSIPLEAQRLGLRAIASDLNPLAVLINKALIELPLALDQLTRAANGPSTGGHWSRYENLLPLLAGGSDQRRAGDSSGSSGGDQSSHRRL